MKEAFRSSAQQKINVIQNHLSLTHRKTLKFFVEQLTGAISTAGRLFFFGFLIYARAEKKIVCGDVSCGVLCDFIDQLEPGRVFLLSQSKLLTKAFTPFVTLLVTLPMMVIVPVYMVWVGYEVNYRAILAFVQVTAIVTLNTLSGFRNIDQNKLDLAASYGASRFQTFFKVIFPNALPEVFQGLRLGCNFTILNVIGIEFIAGKIGMGFSVQYWSGLLKTPLVWGCILIVGITGRLMFMIVQMFERRIVTWKR